MAVAFGAKATSSTTDFNVTTLSNSNLTIGAGSNLALVATVVFQDSVSPTGISVSWDSGGTPQAMTKIAEEFILDKPKTQLWGLLNPTTGNKTLTVSWTNSAECVLDALYFTGVEQSDIANAFIHTTQDTNQNANPTLTVTSTGGNMTVVVAGAAGAGAGTQFASTDTQTELYRFNGANFANSAASYGNGAATVTHTWTLSNYQAGGDWCVAGIDVVASTGTGPAGFMWL